MKKRCVLISILLLAVLLSSCGGKTLDMELENGSGSVETIELTLWTFPIGNWGNPTAVASMLTDFHKKNPGIHVSVEYLTYDSGDEKINQAAADGTLPDLVMEGPERLVANWGEKGWMVDLSDLWESNTADEIYDNIREACHHGNGEYYVFPICMSAHCMAINYDMFKEAGALQYIDEERHTWTTEDFIKAVQALNDYADLIKSSAQEQKISAGIIYCKNQSGDQGTRALVNNLYGGTFTDKAHTYYTVDSEKNIKALQLLYDLEGIVFESSFSSADAIDLFCRKETAMCFCWNGSMEVQQTINHPELDFEVFPMAFPTDQDTPELQGGIWGLGVFDTGEQERIAAAKTFIQYMTENDVPYTRAVRASSYWPVRDMDNLYENDKLMTEYSIFMPYMGDYYQITPEWSQARTAWWQMLAKIGDGADVSEAVKGFLSLE
ncbi:MAG: extracellular solute-binding protein [Acetatifactor sp.]|nr:extracellular solute-binding protein [Acetatifactor sp.]